MSFDQPRVYTTSVLPGEEPSENNMNEVLKKFCDFILEFWIDNSFIYRDQLRENILVKQYFLSVDIGHLISFDENLGQQLVNEPGHVLPTFERAVREVARKIIVPGNLRSEGTDTDIPPCQVLLTSDANITSIRDLKATHISKLVRIPGIIISASTLSSKATVVYLMCRSCRHILKVDVGSGFGPVRAPRNCQAPATAGESKDCPIEPYVVVHDKSNFIDQQYLKLQEAPDMVPVGEMPRHILLTADRHLTNKVIPGTRCTIIGVYSVRDVKKGISKGAVAIRTPYINVVGIQREIDFGTSGSAVFTEEEEEEFLEMARTPDIFSVFAKSIAPSIYGNDDVKKSIACLLVGGSKKILPDGMRLRGDINVLMLGDPGTAKSQLLKFVEKVSPIAIYTSGKGSSAAGLTASVQRDNNTGEFYLEGGAMVLADGGVVCIDEFDKMRDEDRVAIHEAMEQQTISIAKAGITTVLNSRTSVLAAANPIFGRYDDLKSPGENIDFQTTILSRFDMIYIIKDDHNEGRDQTIARHVMGIHMNNNAQPEAVGDIPIDKMKRYISYCRSRCAPTLSTEAAERLSSEFVSIRKSVHQAEQDANERSSIPITIRQLEALIRITESIAKIHLRPVCNVEDVEEALRLFNASTLNAVQEGAGTRKELIEEVNKITAELKRRLPIGWSTSYQTLIREFVGGKGYSQHALNKALTVLERRETIQFRHQRQNVYRSGA
ncbi:component of the hexameric MCM complex [Nadsonia fulvescens var. elongata DSM 6958]|uniref:DNA replication licensing factor MCM5 n=1 Tax=Nadsonia fulvescens var. elongata DSM 6958 TaxID=857566 RepID=A0A1E3PCR8_9ASCO|nr:component of the hexameric MCM complex [Nadsonia fulvescens var. elongata DSM 6958]